MFTYPDHSKTGKSNPFSMRAECRKCEEVGWSGLLRHISSANINQHVQFPVVVRVWVLKDEMLVSLSVPNVDHSELSRAGTISLTTRK